MRRSLEGREAVERVHGRQAQVARASGDAADPLHLVEEGHHQRRVNVVQRQCRGRLAQALVHELQQHPEGVAVRGNRVCTGPALLHPGSPTGVRQLGPENGVGGMLGGRNANGAGGFVPKRTQGRQLGFDLLKSRTHGQEEAFACLGRGDAARGAGQEPNAKPRLKRPDGVAQGRLGHPKLRSRSSKLPARATVRKARR